MTRAGIFPVRLQPPLGLRKSLPEAIQRHVPARK